MLGTIQEIEISTGGMAANNGINLRRLDDSLSVGVMGKVGEDDYGQIVLERLAMYGVDTRGIITCPKMRTSFTDVFSVEGTGVRTFFHHTGANAFWGVEDIKWESVAEAYDWVQLGYILLLDAMDAEDAEYGTCAARALAGFRRLGLQTCIDLVSETGGRARTVVPPALKYVDHLIINELEAERVTDIPLRGKEGFLADDAIKAAEVMLGLGVGQTVVIHAPEGAVGLRRTGETVVQPSHQMLPEAIRGAVGAGDAFCSGVMYGLKAGWSLKEAIRLGTAMGAMNLLDLTATGGARSLAEVLQFMNQTPYRKWPG